MRTMSESEDFDDSHESIEIDPDVILDRENHVDSFRDSARSRTLDLLDPKSVDYLGIEEWSRRFDEAFRQNYNDSSIEDGMGGKTEKKDYYEKIVKPRIELNRRKQSERIIDNNAMILKQQGTENEYTEDDFDAIAYSVEVTEEIFYTTLENIVSRTNISLNYESAFRYIDLLVDANRESLGLIDLKIPGINNKYATIDEVAEHFKGLIDARINNIFSRLNQLNIPIQDGYPIVDIRLENHINEQLEELSNLPSLISVEKDFLIIINYMEKILSSSYINENLKLLLEKKFIPELFEFSTKHPSRYSLRMLKLNRTAPTLAEFIYRHFE